MTIPDPSVLTEELLTSREAGGTGLFDGLMVTMGKHLQVEYEKGRISGKEYAEAWIAATNAALGSAVQYLLARDQAYYQAVLTTKQIEQAQYQITNLLPKELEKAVVSIAGITAQTAQTVYQTTVMMPAQQSGTLIDNNTKTYNLTNLLPKELEKSQKQIDAFTAEIAGTTAKTTQIVYETTNILPTQKAGIEGDNAIKVYQLGTVLPAQTANMVADTAGKAYNNQFLLPANLDTIKENTEANRAKTLDTRINGQPVAGAIGKQIALQQQQIDSFKRDAEAKVGKMFLDTWVTQKSLDEGLLPPTSLSDSNINTILAKIRLNLNLN